MRILVLTLLSFLGCVGTADRDDQPVRTAKMEPTRQEAETPKSLTVAIYNVLYALAGEDGQVDPDTLARATSLDADVLLLQETNEVWERALRPLLDRRFTHCTFHHPKRLLPEGLAICVKGTLIEDSCPLRWGGSRRSGRWQRHARAAYSS